MLQGSGRIDDVVPFALLFSVATFSEKCGQTERLVFAPFRSCAWESEVFIEGTRARGEAMEGKEEGGKGGEREKEKENSPSSWLSITPCELSKGESAPRPSHSSQPLSDPQFSQARVCVDHLPLDSMSKESAALPLSSICILQSRSVVPVSSEQESAPVFPVTILRSLRQVCEKKTTKEGQRRVGGGRRAAPVQLNEVCKVVKSRTATSPLINMLASPSLENEDEVHIRWELLGGERRGSAPCQCGRWKGSSEKREGERERERPRGGKGGEEGKASRGQCAEGGGGRRRR
jgi:hypothetical protein